MTRIDFTGSLLSEQERSGWRETAYLLGSPVNSRQLLGSIRDADAGLVQAHELVSLDGSGAA